MPELPEVETICRSLTEHLIGQTIQQIQVYWPFAVTGWADMSFVEIASGKKIIAIDRRGKYLLIHLQQGWTLIVHLRMTGRLNYYPAAMNPMKHTHVVFCFDQGELHYHDTRKFGRLQAVPTDEALNTGALARMGPEPLSEDFRFEIFTAALQKKKVKIKTALLDQSLIAGIGNIYADEVLFTAGIFPERQAASLSETEIQKLFTAIRTVLQAGIIARGTSFRDYRDANGEKGDFQNQVQVYGRTGLSCRRCGKTLEKLRINGRTTVYCRVCQK